MLRIEDTDRERSTPENVEQILDALRWLELDWDEGPLSQYERADRHREALERAARAGAAYRDTRPPRRQGPEEQQATAGYRGEPAPATGARPCACGSPTRARPSSQDVIRGDVRFDNAVIDDFVIARADGSVALQLRGRGRRRRHGHHRRDPRRRPPLEHARSSCWCWRRWAPTPPALRAPAAAARPRRQEALEAPRRRHRPGAARRRLPARGRAQLPGAARLGLRRRHHVLHHRRAGRALHARATSARASAIFDEQKLRWINGRFMRECRSTSYTGGGRAPPRPRARRARCGRPARSPRRRRRRWTRSGR